MKYRIRKILLGLTLGLCSFTAPSFAAGLLVPSNANSNVELLIKSHDVAVVIENGYAITEVNQVFHNPQANDLEATYRFPVPDKAAVSEFTVWIDNQPVIGEVLEKEHARTVYQEEKAAGREAGIAEKNKHYNFEIKVTPVRSGQDTRIRLVYMQPVDLDTGIGRYVYPLENGGTDDAANSFWSEQAEVQERFSFDLKLRSSIPVSGLRLPAHPQAVITNPDGQYWQVSMMNSVNGSTAMSETLDTEIKFESLENESHEAAATNQASLTTNATTSGMAGTLDTDIVVYWRLSTNAPASVDLVTHKKSDSNTGTFMLTLTPGNDLAPITEGRDWAFVLDMSGSMQGKYASLVDGVQRAMASLNAQDRFRIIRFSDTISELTNGWVVANDAEVSLWSKKLASTQIGGGTDLYAGMDKAIRTLDADRTSVIVLITDGEANVGVTEKKQFLKLMQKRDVRLFTAVMGNGANRNLLEAMTEVSNGFAISVSNSDDIVGKLKEFTSKVSFEAMHDIDLKISGVQTRDLTPKITKTLYRGEQLTVFGHYMGSGDAEVKLSAEISGERKTYKTRFNFPQEDSRNPEIERLWAYANILDMQDMVDYLGDDSEYKSAMIDTAVQYGLVTDHTSMVVMRDESFDARNIERHNKQRRTTEIAAAQQRAVQPVRSTRVDQATPAFQTPRASHSNSNSSNNVGRSITGADVGGSRQSSGNGGGATGFELLLLGFLLVPIALRRKKRQ